jgi:hypothetical protein
VEAFRTETFTRDGVEFTAEFFSDDSGRGFPWDEHDGHGVVRRTSRNPHWHRETDKRPGERPMNKPDRNEDQFYYDWQESMRVARRDGWCMGKTGADFHAAVQADFDYCRAWLSGDKFWVGVRVTSADGAEDSLWGIDSGHSKRDYEYADECAYECAENILHMKRQAWRAALKEARARRYWASRDVETVGA